MADRVIEEHADRLFEKMTKLDLAPKKHYLHGKKIVVTVSTKAGIALINGHGDGREIAGVGSQALSHLLADHPWIDDIETIIFASCWTGLHDYAEMVHNCLQKNVYAPIARGAVSASGNVVAVGKRKVTNRRGTHFDLEMIGESFVSYP